MSVAEKTVDKVRDVWVRYKRTGSDTARDELVLTYLPLVKYIAERVKAKLPNTVQVNDLESAGIFGLFDAVDKFDLERDVKFETYCSTRIRGAILDELRKLDWVPRLVRSHAHQLEEVSKDLHRKLGRLPAEEEIADAMGLSMKDFDDLATSASAVTMVPFSTRFGDDDEGHTEQGAALIPDEKMVDPSGKMQKEEIKDVITRDLSEREKMVVLLYYFDELTLKEIGAALNLSESRVCQIHSRVLLRLKGLLRPKRQDIWPE